MLTESTQSSKTKASKYFDWMGHIRGGGELPLPDSGNWDKFERAWRGWYKTSVKHENENKRKENDYFYRVGKKHIEEVVGWRITEIEYTGSIKTSKPSKWLTEGESLGDKQYEVQYEIA